jgi:hypothetical protein
MRPAARPGENMSRIRSWSSRMGSLRFAVGALALTALVVGFSPTALGQPVGASTSNTAPPSRAVGPIGPGEHASCPASHHHTARCLSIWRRGTPRRASAALSGAVARPAKGLGPADIRSAYRLPATGGHGQTIAVVDAFDNPNVVSDLKAYRKAWGLPACSTSGGCFRKVNQRGGTKAPAGDPDWGVETALDVQAVSAACPGCSILLVEADDDSLASLGAAVNTAVRLGANVVSNSYGTDEFTGMIALGRKYYLHPGTAIVASSGDSGFTAASFPAVLATTWSVGGTTLNGSAGKGWNEDAWEGAGSGCSAWIAKPAVQKDPNCEMRTVADVSAVADPDTGFAVYDTYGLDEDDGWIVVGGTSVSAPLISGMIGLAGNAATASTPAYAYAHRSGLNDVVGGSNGYCGGDYLCTGVKGYDAPTGLGTPKGLSAL